LETIETFHPQVAVILNITPDHLDRHRTFQAYADAKARIFENQQANDFAILNADDPACLAMRERTRAAIFWFSRKREVEQGAHVAGGKIMFRDGQSQQDVMPVSDISLKGTHNVENVLAAVAAGMLLGCAPAAIRDAVENFKAVAHRLQYVATIA